VLFSLSADESLLIRSLVRFDAIPPADPLHFWIQATPTTKSACQKLVNDLYFVVDIAVYSGRRRRQAVTGSDCADEDGSE
jgi:hypothetical protein